MKAGLTAVTWGLFNVVFGLLALIVGTIGFAVLMVLACFFAALPYLIVVAFIFALAKSAGLF